MNTNPSITILLMKRVAFVREYAARYVKLASPSTLANALRPLQLGWTMPLPAPV